MTSDVQEENCDRFAITPFQQMAASSTGAMVTSLFVTPLDVVKIRLQAQQKAFMSNKCFLYCNGLMDHLCPSCVNGNVSNTWIQRPSYFNGTIDAFVKIVKTEGITSLWSGLPPTLLMAMPATVVYFTAYEQLRKSFTKFGSRNTTDYVFWAPMAAGAFARLIAATFISPLELIRTKMQSKKLSYREIGEAIRLLVQQRGYISLWKGLGPTILRDVPFSALYWSNYEFVKHKFGVKEPKFWFSFASGAYAGTMAAVLTLPFDVVKTHRQIELGEMEIYTVQALARTRHLDTPKKSASTFHILRRIYTSSGPKALFTGIVPRVVKVAPACAIMISTYEYGKSFFRQWNEIRCLKNKNSSSLL